MKVLVRIRTRVMVARSAAARDTTREVLSDAAVNACRLAARCSDSARTIKLPRLDVSVPLQNGALSAKEQDAGEVLDVPKSHDGAQKGRLDDV
jgi:hypothetical protein